MAPAPSKPVAEPGPLMCKAKAKAQCEPTPEPPEDDAPVPTPGKGCRAGVKNLMAKDKLDFEQVYKTYNKRHQPRALKTLKGIWCSLTTGPPPTGNPEMEEVVALALEVDMVLNVATEMKQLDGDAVPPPVVDEEEQAGKREDEDDGDNEDEDNKNGDDALDWVLTEDEAARPTEPGVSKKTTILVAGTPSLQEGDVNPKPQPKPKARPQPLDQHSPATATTIATPAHAATMQAKVPLASNSGSSVKPKVKAKPGSATKVKGKGKLAPVFTDIILKVTDSESDAAHPVPPKRKAKAEPIKNSRLVRRKPEIDTTAVRTAATHTHQNADTLVTRMLDTFDPMSVKKAAELQQSHTRENMMVFDQQQRIQSLESQLVEANRRTGDEREKYFNAWLELNQVQMQLAMYGRLGLGGAGAAAPGVPGFGLAPAAFSAAGGFPGVYAPIPQLQATNLGVGAHPGMPNAPYHIPQPGLQQPGEGFGVYNPLVQPGTFPVVLDNPAAPIPPIPPITPTINIQAPTSVDTPNAQNVDAPPS